jgi:hypothetical protein
MGREQGDDFSGARVAVGQHSYGYAAFEEVLHRSTHPGSAPTVADETSGPRHRPAKVESGEFAIRHRDPAIEQVLNVAASSNRCVVSPVTKRLKSPTVEYPPPAAVPLSGSVASAGLSGCCIPN